MRGKILEGLSLDFGALESSSNGVLINFEDAPMLHLQNVKYKSNS